MFSSGRPRPSRVCGFAVAWTFCIALAGCASIQTPVAKSVAVDARPNGIALRPADGALFITDDKTSAVLSSSDGKTFAPFASIPALEGQGVSLSQIAFTGSGSLLVERFGFGSASAIFDIHGSGPAVPISGLDPARRRLGLVVAGDGKVLSSWFIKAGKAPPSGGVSLVTYDPSTHAGVEHDLLAGLGKPVGMAVKGDTLFVADQDRNVIVKASLGALMSASGPATSAATVARIDGPDLMTIDDSGALYTKCNPTGLCKITPDGTVSVIANDLQDARGVAIDPAHHVLYVIDRAHSASGASYVRTIPLK
jgi:DNA-binding beta-propeller fold protein YncE